MEMTILTHVSLMLVDYKVLQIWIFKNTQRIVTFFAVQERSIDLTAAESKNLLQFIRPGIFAEWKTVGRFLP